MCRREGSRGRWQVTVMPAGGRGCGVQQGRPGGHGLTGKAAGSRSRDKFLANSCPALEGPTLKSSELPVPGGVQKTC